MATKTATEKTYDFFTGFDETLKMTKKSNYDLKFKAGEEYVIPEFDLTSNGKDIVAHSGRAYYAVAQVSRDYVEDGNIRDAQGNLVKLSIVDELYSATYKSNTSEETINIYEYRELSVEERANYTFQTGTIQLDLQTHVAHSNETRYNQYVFATDTLYEMPKGYKFPKEKQFNTNRAVSIILNNTEAVAATTETGTVYQEGMTLSNMKVYKVTNGAEADFTTAYIAGLDAAGEKTSNDTATYNAKLFAIESSSVVLKNFASYGTVTVTTSDESYDLYEYLSDYTFNVSMAKGKKSYTGSRLNEAISSTAANEKFNMGTGSDQVVFHNPLEQLTAFGKDTVTVNKEESLGVLFGEYDPEKVAFSYAKKGNDAVITATTTHEMSYEKWTITGAKKITEGENKGKWTYSGQYSYYNGTAWVDGEIEPGLISDTKVKNGTTYNTYADGDLLATSTKAPKKFDATTTTADTATLKNYFKVGHAASVYTDLEGTELNPYNSLSDVLEDEYGVGIFGDATSKTNQKLTGNFLDNTFFTGEGNDTVKTGSSYRFGDGDVVFTSAGKDTITIDGAGTKTIDASGLVATSTKAADTTISFTKAGMQTVKSGELIFPTSSVNVDDLADDFEFTKSGNNLVVENGVNATLTVKNFFKTDYIAQNTFFEDDSFDELNESYSDADYKYQLVQKGKAGKAVKFTDTVYYDDLRGDVKNDTFTFKNGGYDRAFGGEGNDTYKVQVANANEADVKEYIYLKDEKGNDTYDIKNFNENVYINDLEGKDTLAFTKDSAAVFVFDVLNPEADAVLANHSFLFYQDAETIDLSTLRTVEVANFFDVDQEGDYVAGAGAMETIKMGSKSAAINDDFFALVNEMRENVAAWLSDTDYGSAYDVLQKGDAADIQALLECYSVDMDPKPQA